MNSDKIDFERSEFHQQLDQVRAQLNLLREDLQKLRDLKH